MHKFIKGLCLTSLMGCLWATPAPAHHGFALHFDPAEQVYFDGTITALNLRNPHSHIEITTQNESGATVTWRCEFQSATILKRKGLSAADFPIGETVSARGSAHRTKMHECELGEVNRPDGRQIMFRTDQGRAVIGVNKGYEVAPQARASIFGNWVRNSFNGSGVRPSTILPKINADGQAVNAAYDPTTDDPSLNCVAANPVRAWIAPGDPTQISREDDKIIIDHEFMDTQRIIYLDQNYAPPKDERSTMGHARGWLDDGVLHVYITHFTEGTLLTHLAGSGVMHSNAMTLKERYELDKETGELLYSWQAIDPNYFIEPLIGDLRLTATRLPINKYNCVKGH